MNYYQYLKHRFPFYIISGIILALAIFSLIALHRYGNSLSQILANINIISSNKHKVERQIKEIDAVIKSFKGEFNMDIADMYPERMIFRVLDQMKRDLGDADIRVKNFEEKGGGKELPIEIVATISSYQMIIDYARYIESFRIPDCKINSLYIMKDGSGKIVLHISGVLVMPFFQAAILRTGNVYG